MDQTGETQLRELYRELEQEGRHVAPRGLKVLELENHQLRLPPRARWANFAARKLKIEYLRREFRWYLRADPKDLSIAEVAKLWGSILNPDGSVNSNYGQYLVGGGGLEWVVAELRRDPDSRRAVAVILRPDHLHVNNKDVPCTYSLAFRIRDRRLNMSVHMRSQDAIWGLGNDLPCFSLFHELVAALLELPMGEYCQTVDSMHVYERHWPMLTEIVLGSPYEPVNVPLITGAAEARDLLAGRVEDSPYAFTRWLYQERGETEPFP